MDEFQLWHQEKMLEEAARALRICGYNAHMFGDRESARKKLFDLITPDHSVGIAGSMSIREMEIIGELEERGNRVVHHWIPGLSRREDAEKRREENAADIFLASANAVTMEGEIVNMDGVGNRVSGMIYGPGKVILVVGMNKVCRSREEALWRIRNIATPINARRLGIKVPCAETGFCVDCKSADRLCRALTILERRPARTEYEIILIVEPLGY